MLTLNSEERKLIYNRLENNSLRNINQISRFFYADTNKINIFSERKLDSLFNKIQNLLSSLYEQIMMRTEYEMFFYPNLIHEGPQFYEEIFKNIILLLVRVNEYNKNFNDTLKIDVIYVCERFLYLYEPFVPKEHSNQIKQLLEPIKPFCPASLAPSNP